MSVVVFHPMVAPHVQQAARAIHEAGQLERFITSVRDNPSSLSQRAMTVAGRLAGLDLKREFGRRAIHDIPLDRVESHPWGELLRLAVGRVDRDRRLTDRVWERAELGFDRLVANRIGPPVTGVYGFEFGCLATFTRAKKLGIARGYEMPAPDPEFVHGLLRAEAEKFPELATSYDRHTAAREDGRTARRRAEWGLADVIIAASRFTRDSYARAGLDVSRVRVIPLGAPAPTPARPPAPPSSPLRLLWAGTFGVRKGAHYLLEAWRSGKYADRARLVVLGSAELPDRILNPVPPGVELRGPVPRDALMEEYARADALIFPTLCDGFGMVATEAWSRGLPVITTDRAGASDLLRPGENGLMIKAGDPAAINAAIEWCLTHRGELAAMREPSRATAARWQWTDYRQALANTLRDAGLFDRGS